MQHSCGSPREGLSSEPTRFVAAPDGPGRLRLLGELDLAGGPEVWARLAGTDADVELDCAGLTFIDASGVRLFLALRAACAARGGRLSIVNPSPCVIRLLDLTGRAAALDVGADWSAA
jgi:anti-anti-sigma factor